MKKQTEPISYLLIFLVAISLISTILFYFLPYIRKSQDETKVNLIYNKLFGSKDSLIEAVRKAILTGEQTRIDAAFEVNWNITSKTIEVTFYSSVSPFSDNNAWVLIEGCTKQVCYFGLDPFYKIEGKARKIEDTYEITYRLTAIDVKQDNKDLKINFIPSKNLWTSRFAIVSLRNFDASTNTYNIFIDVS